MPTTTINANLNAADCIQTTNNFTNTVYHNICTGQVTTIPDGSGDLFLGSFVCLFLIGMVVVLGAIIFKSITE